MLKPFALKSRSRGLIVFLAVSLFATAHFGCVGTKKISNYINDPFYPEYYSAKKLDTDDIVRLRGYAASLDKTTSDAASLVLGQYYLKFGDKSYGDFLINKYYKSSALNEQMKLFGKLWKAETLVASKKTGEAGDIIENIKKMPQDETFFRTMNIYCRKIKVAVTGNDFNNCLDAIISPKTAYELELAEVINDMPETNDNLTMFEGMTYEEYVRTQNDNVTEERPTLSKDSAINIIDGEVMSDFVQGMIYAISKFGSSYQINSVGEDDKAAQRFAVNIKVKSDEIDVSGTTTYLGINWEELAYIAANLKFINKYDRVLIGAPKDKLAYAKTIETTIKARNKYVKTMNYSNSNFQISLKEELERSDNATTLIIGLGDEEEILSFAPVAKFLQKDTVTQRILIVTSWLGDVKRNPEYANYFRNLYVLTPIRTINNPNIQSVADDYESYFGVKMTVTNMIGYDTIVYLNELIDNEAKQEYITNITGFVNYKAHRPIGLYRFNKQLQLIEEQPTLMTMEPEEEMGIGFTENPLGDNR